MNVPLSQVVARVEPIGGSCTLACGHVIQHRPVIGQCTTAAHHCMQCANGGVMPQNPFDGQEVQAPPANVVPFRKRAG